MNSFLKNVLKTIKKYNLITPGDTVLVGVSGGADSVALLKSLISLKETLKIKKIVQHQITLGGTFFQCFCYNLSL